jgi:hypothetical protein
MTGVTGPIGAINQGFRKKKTQYPNHALNAWCFSHHTPAQNHHLHSRFQTGHRCVVNCQQEDGNF